MGKGSQCPVIPQTLIAQGTFRLCPGSCHPEEGSLFHGTGKVCTVHYLKSKVFISAFSLQITTVLPTTVLGHAVTPFSKIPEPHFLGALFLPLESAGQYWGAYLLEGGLSGGHSFRNQLHPNPTCLRNQGPNPKSHNSTHRAWRREEPAAETPGGWCPCP